MVGGDLKVEKYRFRARPQNKHFVLFPADQASHSISMFSVIILLCKISLDTDPFFSYIDLNKCGIIEALIAIILVIILIQISINLYIRCWFYGTAYNYENIWVCVFGSRAFQFIPTILNILAYLTYVVWFTFEIHDNAATFLKVVWPNVPSFLTNKWFLSYIINLITVVPCLFVKRFSSLTWVACVGNIAMIISIVCLIILLARNAHDLNFNVQIEKEATIEKDDFPYLPFTSLFSKNVGAFFYCIGSVMTAFYMHPMLDMVFSEMKNPTVCRCLSSTWIVGIISIVVFYGIGLISYFIIQINLQDFIHVSNLISDGKLSIDSTQFLNRPFNIFSFNLNGEVEELNNENVFFNFNTNHVEALIGMVATYIVTLTTNMIYHYFLATQVSSLVIRRKQDDIPPLIISGVVVILFCIGINFMDDTATEILDMISIIAFCIMVFILPPVFYLKLYRFTNAFWGALSLFVLVIGIALSVTVVYFNSKEIF